MSTATPLSAAASTTPTALSSPPHRTFSSLVQAENDFIGHVAYALYKRDKLKFCDQESQRIGGGPPDPSVVDAFIRSCSIDTRIAAYRVEAERLLEQMTEFVLEDATTKLQEQFQEELVQKLREGKSWWRVIAESVVGSVFVAFVWAAIVVAIQMAKIGPDQVIGDLMGKEIKDKAPTAAPAAPR